ADQAEQEVLGADVVVIELPGFFLRQHHDPAGPVGKPLEHAPRRPSHPHVRPCPALIRYIALTGIIPVGGVSSTLDRQWPGFMANGPTALLCGGRFVVPAVTPIAGHGAEGERQGTSARAILMPSGSDPRPGPEGSGPGAHHPRRGADLGSLPRPAVSFQPRWSRVAAAPASLVRGHRSCGNAGAATGGGPSCAQRSIPGSWLSGWRRSSISLTWPRGG